jgi:murein endopeptidase
MAGRQDPITFGTGSDFLWRNHVRIEHWWGIEEQLHLRILVPFKHLYCCPQHSPYTIS